MNGIDVSSWNRGIDISKVPCDFVIAKATQGNYYVNPDCDRVIQQCIKYHKKYGVYHYINGDYKEIDHFINSVRGYVGRAILCLDWERGSNKRWGDLEYLEHCISTVIRKTGVPPIVYASKSCFPYQICKKYNCGTWIAQYGSNRATGYQSHPWNEQNCPCVIRQYSSNGRLSGYVGNLDLNKSYIDASQWARYANPKTTVNVSRETFDVLALAISTIKGKYGTGIERKVSLGDKYEKVQNEVNHIYRLVQETKHGKFGNGVTRKKLLGNYYDIVQWVINHEK